MFIFFISFESHAHMNRHKHTHSHINRHTQFLPSGLLVVLFLSWLLAGNASLIKRHPDNCMKAMCGSACVCVFLFVCCCSR